MKDDPAAKKRHFWLILLTIIFVSIGVIFFFYWLLYGRFYVETDDAYVAGNRVYISSQVASSVQTIYADNTDLVEQGQPIIVLDNTSFLLDLEQKKKLLADTVREVAALFKTVKENEALLEIRRSEKELAALEYNHRLDLVQTGAISLEDFETIKSKMEVTKAYYTYAQRDLEKAKIQTEGTEIATHPRVLVAVENLKNSYLNLLQCEIQSPVTGFVSKRTVQLGDWILPGESLMMVVPLEDLWLEANYKETQLKQVRIGQDVSFTADLYGGKPSFHGKVVGFSAGTGNAFSLLPAQNASGNWIKIVQRLPIRIYIDCQELKKHPLFIGLSLRVKTDVHDTSLPMLAELPHRAARYTTVIYETQKSDLEKYEPEIQKIIVDNAGTN